MIYIGFTVFLFSLSFILGQFKITKNQIYFSVLLILFLFSAFRYQVGCDWDPYYYLYKNVPNIDWKINTSIREPLFQLIYFIGDEFSLPYPFINIFSSAIFFTGIHILAKRQPDPLSFLVICFPILIINMPMSGIRQGAAIGVICIALVAFVNRSPFKYLFWVIIATGFHSSAIVFLLLIPFATGRYNNTRIALTFLMLIPCTIYAVGLDSAQFAVKTYVGSGREAHGAVFRVGFLFLSGIYFLLFLKNKWKNTSPFDYSLVSLGAIIMILLILLVPVSTIISDRFGYYLIPIQAMIFSRIPFLHFQRLHLFHSVLPYLGILILFVAWINLSWHFEECYLPYKNWIFGFPSEDFLR